MKGVPKVQSQKIHSVVNKQIAILRMLDFGIVNCTFICSGLWRWYHFGVMKVSILNVIGIILRRVRMKSVSLLFSSV